MRLPLVLPSLLLSSVALAQSPKQIDALVAKAMRRYRVPGMSVAVVKDGKVLLAKGYGVKELGKPERVTEHTLFQIASNTKFFTATALALLVEEGRVKWDEPVITYLPDFAMYDPWVTKNITVRDLLVHRSGLGLGAGDLLWWPASTYTRSEMNSRLRFIKPATSFRSAYAYDNVLYNVAGDVIEKVSGQTWEKFVGSRILKPVGMRDSVPLNSELAAAEDHAATHGDVDGSLRVIAPFLSDACAPAGGIGSNAVDLSRWLLLHLDGGKGLLKPESERELTTLVVLKPGPYAFGGYALGMGVGDDGGHKRLGHGGGLPGFVSTLSMVPDARIGIAVLTNSETEASSMLTQAILDIALRRKGSKVVADLNKHDVVPPAQAFKVPSLDPLPPPAELARFAGEYEDAWYGGVAVAAEGGMLVVRFSRTPGLVGDVVGLLKGRYYVKWRDRELRADATIGFEEKGGKVVRATLLPAVPEVDFSFDFQDLDLIRKG